MWEKSHYSTGTNIFNNVAWKRWPHHNRTDVSVEKRGGQVVLHDPIHETFIWTQVWLLTVLYATNFIAIRLKTMRPSNDYRFLINKCIVHVHVETSSLRKSNAMRLTKMEIWRRKSTRTASAAYSEKIFTAGMSVTAPVIIQPVQEQLFSFSLQDVWTPRVCIGGTNRGRRRRIPTDWSEACSVRRDQPLHRCALHEWNPPVASIAE